MMNKDDFKNYALTLEQEITELRRDFHKHAESAWLEFRTASILAEKLEELGLRVTAGKELFSGERLNVPPEDVLEDAYSRALNEGGAKKWLEPMKGGYTGVVAEIGEGEPITAMRFDIDALPFSECREEGYRPYDLGFASIHEDACHSCGHDGHAAMSIGVAKLLKKYESEITGTVRLVIQPAEEGIQGAEPMVRAGIMDGVSSVLAAHITVAMQPCTIGNFDKKWAQSNKFDIELFGKAAHSGCHPEGGINAMLASAAIIQNLYALPRNTAGFTRVNVGKINAGIARNSISPYSYMLAETRAENNEVGEKIYEQAKKVVEHGAAMHGCTFNIIPKGGAMSAKNDPELVERVKAVASSLDGIGLYEDQSPDDGGCEDYTRMMKAVQESGGKAVHMYVGADFKDEPSWSDLHKNMSISLHSSRFDINEKGLVHGSMVLAWLLLNL